MRGIEQVLKNCDNCLFHNICRHSSSEWEENFKHLPFITEACNLGDSIRIFIKYIDNYVFLPLYIESCESITLVFTALYGAALLESLLPPGVSTFFLDFIFYNSWYGFHVGGFLADRHSDAV